MNILLVIALLPSLVYAAVPHYRCEVKNAESDTDLCHYCYTSWQIQPDNSTLVTQQGCFNYDGPKDAAAECLNSQCINIVNEGESYEQGLRFCCCIGHYCNSHFLEELEPQQSFVNLALYIGGSVAFAFLVLYLVLICKILSGYKLFWRRKPQNNESGSLKVVATMDEASLELGQINFSDFVLDEKVCLGQGNYGSSLHRAQRGSKSLLSVKVFTQSQKQGFFNEKEVYEIASKSNEKYAFLQFFGTREKVTLNDGSTHDYMIGLEHNSRGFLADFLQDNTISWADLCRMLTSISSGLSHLHSGFGSHKTFPSFCHRDLNSRNILVRSDLSCCLCNFEKSVIVGGGGSATTSSSEIVGTPRYLAPEVLENTLNLHDSESSLKQVDVYAMGLVFWELSRRCHDLYQGVPVPTFDLAFHQELAGCSSPTFDQMKVLVAIRKARPLFPEVWKNSNPAIQRLRETIEDSWDQDGEARVTAFCVVERARELSALWERYMNNIRHHIVKKEASNNIVNLQTLQRKPVLESNDLRPNNRILPTKNDNVLSRQQPLVQLQPHQGRNPCLERNNYFDSVSAAPLLVHGSFKDRQIRHQNAEAADASAAATPLRRPQRPRPAAHPIPYLQNDLTSRGLDEPAAARAGPSKGRFPFFKNTKKTKTKSTNFERQQLLRSSSGSGQPSCAE